MLMIVYSLNLLIRAEGDDVMLRSGQLKRTPLRAWRISQREVHTGLTSEMMRPVKRRLKKPWRTGLSLKTTRRAPRTLRWLT